MSLRAIAWMRSRVVTGMRGLFARHIDTVAWVTPACTAIDFMVTPKLIAVRRPARSNWMQSSRCRGMMTA